MRTGSSNARASAWVATVAGVVCLALLATSCAQGSADGATGTLTKATNVGVAKSNEKPRRGGKLVYGLQAETNGWNPATNQWAASGLTVSRAIFDTLAAYDENSQIQPNLAERFEHNPDYTEWTIHLRPGVKLHNGRPVDAEVVVRNQRYLQTSLVTRGAYILVDTIEPAGPLAVRVELNKPWVIFPHALATQIGVVADPDWLESNDSLHPIGTGPFVFDRWQIDNHLIVKRNPSYWRSDGDGGTLPYLEEVEFQVMPDTSSRAKSLESGQSDLIQVNTPDQIATFQDRAANGEFQVFANTKGENAEFFVQLNTMAPPLDDIDARRALAHATDQQAVIEAIGAGLYEPATGPFAPGSRWYAPNDYPRFDLAKARELADRVKARNGGRFEIELLSQPNLDGTRLAQFLQQMWGQAGITVSLKTMDQATGIVAVITGRYQAVVWQQFDFPSPAGDSVWWLPDLVQPIGELSLNFARIQDEQLGRALHEAWETTDVAVQDERYRFVGQRLGELVPYVWLYHSQIAVVARPRVMNVIDHTLPGGQKGLPMMQGSTSLTQVWLRGTG